MNIRPRTAGSVPENRFLAAATDCSRIHEQFNGPAIVAFGFLQGAWVGRHGVRLPAPVRPTCDDRSKWMARVAEAKAVIGGGRIHKLVLGRAELRAPAAGQLFSLADAFASLRDRRPDAHTFLIPTGAASGYIGATPELVAELRGRTLRTQALAGTAPADQGDALLHSAKDLHEHRLVVEALGQGLAPLSDELRVADRPALSTAGDVVHLHTPVRARLRPGVDLLSVAAALHPTPALSGWPNGAARAWHLAREVFPAALYRGLVGEVRPDGDGELYAAIRMAHVAPHEALLWSGAGIVAASDPAAEWDETEWKLGAMRDVLPSSDAQAVR